MAQHPIRFTRPNGRQDEFIPWSAQQLDDLAAVQLTDKQHAETYWKRYLPPRLRGMFDAVSSIALRLV